VPDASVLLKWVLPHDVEPDQARALQLRDAILEGAVACRVPKLWFFEVGNTLARLVPAQAAAMLDALQRFGLEEVERAGSPSANTGMENDAASNANSRATRRCNAKIFGNLC
jgi:hypothetical protein